MVQSIPGGRWPIFLASFGLILGLHVGAQAQPITWTGGGSSSFGLTEGTTSVSVTNPCNTQTVTAVFANPSSVALTPFAGLTGGGTVPYMGMNATAVGQATSLTITFGGGQPVENLAFIIYDVDQQDGSGSSWTDILTVTAFFGPTATATNVACASGSCVWTVAGSGTTTAVITGDNNNPTFLNTPGQASVSIPGPVDRVVVNYSAGGPGTNNQFVGFSDLNFNCSTVPVTVSRFEARPAGDGLRVEWSTAAETGNIGFELLGEVGESWQRLTPKLIPSHQLDSLEPQSYGVTIGAAALAADRLMLAEVDYRGQRRLHGPFTIGEPFGDRKRAGGEPSEIGWPAIHAEHRALADGRVRAKGRDDRTGGRFPACELRVAEDGLYRVSHEQLSAAGCDLAGAAITELALTRNGNRVPLRVISRDTVWGTGDRIELLGKARDSIYSRTQVYLLAVDAGSAEPIRNRRAVPATRAVEVSTTTRWVEEQRYYSFSSPTADPWYAEPLLAYTTPLSKELPIEVDHLAAGPARLQVEIWGVTDLPDVELDHHVVVSLNGVELGELLFGGLTDRRLDVELPTGLLREGENRVTLTLPGDTGAPFDLVHLDRYGVSYPRHSVANRDRLSLTARERELAVSGLSSPDVAIYAESTLGLHRLTGFAVKPDGTGYRAVFRADAERAKTYWVTTGEAFLVPEIRPARRPKGLLEGRAEYLVISHSSFSDRLDSLLAARQRQGYSTKVVEIEDLYAAYTGGNLDPEAIRAYLRDAARVLGVRMVLLVGGDSYDYLDHLGVGSMSFVPTLYATTHPVVRHAPADSLLADLDGDRVPDLPIGRLPARTLAELNILLDKTLAYRSTTRAALFAADATDGRVSFTQISDELAAQLPADWSIERAYLDHLTLPAAREALLGAFAGGVPLISYLGHSGPMSWSFDNLLTVSDGRSLLASPNPPLVLAWGCWNGYHSAPRYDTLTHELLLRPGGAAAVLGASGLTSASSDRDLARGVLAAAFEPGMTLGEAILTAKRLLAHQPGTTDVVVGMTLLGDPALRLEP